MRRLLIIALLIVIAVKAGGPGLLAAGEATKPRLVVVIINHVSWEDLYHARAPHLQWMIKEGAVGLLNVKNSQGYLASSSFLTMAMSSRTRLDETAGLAYNAQEMVPGLNIRGGELFAQLTGEKPVRTGIVVPQRAKIRKFVAAVDAQAQPGALGQLLVDHGLQVAVFGNADLAQEQHREAALLVMDRSGRIARGSVGREFIFADPKSPLGLRTNYEVLKQRVAASSAQLIVVETGDSSRLEYSSAMFEPAALRAWRRWAVEQADAFCGWVLQEVKPDYLLVFGANANSEMIAAGNFGLTPILLYGKGAGLLSSDSTRRPGFVTNLDMYSTIAGLLGIQPKHPGKGFPMTVQPSPLGVEYLIGQVNYYQNLRNVRYAITDGLVLLYIIWLLLGLIGVWQGFSPKLTRYYLQGVYALILMPLGLIVGAAWGYQPVWPALLTAVGFSVAVGWLLSRFLPVARVMATAAWLVTGLLLADVFTGAHWMLRSAMGSDVIAAGRFYGMGNDLMGVTLGWLLTGAGLWFQEAPALRRTARYWLPALIVLAAVGVGFPQFGANVGGLITAFMAVGAVVFVLFRIKVSLQRVLGFFCTVIGTVVFIATLDALFNPQPTHAGRAIMTLVGHGQAGFFHIVRVKLGILFSTIKNSAWTWLFLVELVGFGTVKRFRPGFMARLGQTCPAWLEMGWPIAVSALFALAVNDTGIIAAALVLVVYCLAALALFLQGVAVTEGQPVAADGEPGNAVQT